MGTAAPETAAPAAPAPAAHAPRAGARAIDCDAGCAARASPETRARLLATGADVVSVVCETTVAPGFWFT
jgi:hypothetical protein